MLRKLTLALMLGATVALAGCAASDNANMTTNRANANNANTNGSPAREGVVETNANVPSNLNGNTVSSNTAVVTNNNGNANTAGVSTTNTNNHNGNGNKAGHNQNNSNHP